jgi:hypothetical protein
LSAFQRFEWLDTLILLVGDSPVSTLLAKTQTPSTGAARYSQLGTIRPRVGIVPIVVAEPRKISLPILGAAFPRRFQTLDFTGIREFGIGGVHRKWMLQHYSPVSSFTGFP